MSHGSNIKHEPRGGVFHPNGDPKLYAQNCSCGHAHQFTPGKKEGEHTDTTKGWQESHQQFNTLILCPHSNNELIFAFGGGVPSEQ